MGDDLETAIRYYRYRHAGQSRGTHAIAEKDGGKDDDKSVWQDRLHGAAAFLDAACAAGADFQRQEEEALAEALADRAAQVEEAVRELMATAAEVAEVLLPKIRGGDALPEASLRILNERLKTGLLKGDALPEALLGAVAPGAKLYPNLTRKVEGLCNRSWGETELKAREALRSLLLQRGLDAGLDGRRDAFAAALEKQMCELFAAHAQILSQSDHRPVSGRLTPSDGVEHRAGPLAVMCWNVMEFPLPGAAKPVLDGVKPYCDLLQKHLKRKGSEEQRALRDAMCSEAVITQHIEGVLRTIGDALIGGGADVVLLQEVGGTLRRRLLEDIPQRGLHVIISEANSDPSKCDAATAIIARDLFDEESQVEIQENKKTRRFAAARWGQTWVVSCHVPLVTGKAQEDGESVAVRVMAQLAERCFTTEGPNRTKLLIAGGDWNADVLEVARRTAAAPPQGCAKVRLHAPADGEGGTCFGTPQPIDGIFVMHPA